MSITLQRVAAGDTNYITKHNSNADTLEGAVNTLQTQVAQQATAAGAFVGLTDTPASYAGQANRVVTVSATEDGLQFSAAAAPSTFVGLTDAPAAYTGAGNKKVRVNAGATGLEFVADTFLSLADTPSAYAGAGQKLIAVKTTEDGLEFVTAAAPTSFLAMSDTPAAYTGAAQYYVRVNAGATALEFVQFDPGVTSFTDLADAPPDYTGNAGKAIVVNAGATGLEFSTINPSNFLALTDTPSDYVGQAYRAVVVNGTEDGLAYADTATPTSFIGLTDTPAAYTGAGGKVVAVKADASGLEFVDVATDAEVAAAIAAHAAEADPHTQYQRESEKGAASGYASLDADGKVPAAQIPAQPYIMAGAWKGTPGASEVVMHHVFTDAVTLPTSFTGSQGVADTAATAQTDFDVKKGGVSIGTMRFAAGATTASFISAAGGSFIAGNVAKVIAPATPDATLAGLAFTLRGMR